MYPFADKKKTKKKFTTFEGPFEFALIKSQITIAFYKCYKFYW